VLTVVVILTADPSYSNPQGFQWGNLKQKDQVEYTGTDEIIILKWMLKNQDGRIWTGSI
jgi:hypothetical protein